MKQLAYILCLLGGTMLPAGAIAAEQTDSVSPTVDLEEIVVKGERAWIEGNKAVFIPSKKEKNLANDPATLVDKMNIPTVYVENGMIKSLRGTNIPIFINGIEAEGIDLSTFWPKNAIRVEYIDHPTDPIYKGYTCVLNFVMQEYSFGGITKINADQTFPNNGDYDVASKLVYKDMTYSVKLRGQYSRNHSSHSTGEDNYNDIWYNGDFYENIKRQFNSNSFSRSEGADASFSARYLKQNKLVITHNAAFRWNRNPGSGTNYAESWSPNLFDSFNSYSWNNSRGVSPQFSGTYAVQLTPTSYMSVGWSYAYSHNNNHSGSQTGELDPILNAYKENTHAGSINALYTAMFGKVFFNFTANSQMNWYNTLYSGSVNTDYRQWRGQTNLSTSVGYKISPQSSISFTPAAVISYWHSGNNERHTEVQPSADLSYGWSPSRKFSLNTSLYYANFTPGASESTDLLIRQNELQWLQGSSNLKNTEWWSFHLSGTWLTTDFLRLSASGSYARHFNNTYLKYTAASPELGGVISTYANGSPYDWLDLQIIAHLSLFNNRLNITLNPVYQWFKYRGEYACTFNQLRMRNYATFTLGNFEFNLTYNTSQKGKDNNGRDYSWYSGTWNFGVTYGQGDIYCNLSINNIFNRYSKTESWMMPGVFESCTDNFNIGRNISVSLTYTFDYGKKVNRSIDISGPQTIKSGALTGD